MAGPRATRGQLVYRGLHCKVHFDPDKKGIQALALSDDMGDACETWIRTKALPYAIKISPRSNNRREEDRDKPHYQDSFKTDRIVVGAPPSDLIIGKPPMMRRAARLLNVAPHAYGVEWGYSKSARVGRRRPHRVFGKVIARFNRPHVDAF